MDYIGPIHKAFNPALRFSFPDTIEVEGIGVLWVKRPWEKKRRERKLYKHLRTSNAKRRFWIWYKREHPKRYEQYVNAGKWLTPEEGKRIYGNKA